MQQGSTHITMWNLTSPTSNLTDDLSSTVQQPTQLRWGMLSLVLVIICAASGNLLVCMAVCWERRLQNMTNYFLMSLAIADFLVSILVMPLGMVVEIFGFFPMSAHVCLFWITTDVLMCTASIWHMSTMSMDRFFTLKYPMRYGRNKTKHMVCVKILFVWFVSIAVSCPISINGLLDTRTVFNDGNCIPTLPMFIIYGSVFAFYIPLLIMIVTYALTIQILWDNQNLMQRIEKLDRRPSDKALAVKKEYSMTSRSQPEPNPENPNNRGVTSETDGPDTNVVGISEIGRVDIPQALIQHHESRFSRAHWTKCDSVRSSFDSAQTTITTCTLGSEQGTSNAPTRPGSESVPPLMDPKKMRRKSLQLPLQRRRCSKVHFERVPSADHVKEIPIPIPLYPSKSYSHLMEINQWNVSSLVKGSHYHSYHGLNNNITIDPKNPYDQIPDDVFPCLIGLVDEDEDENDDVFEAGDEAAHCRVIQNGMIPMRVSVSSVDEAVSEKDEDVESQTKVETKNPDTYQTKSKSTCNTPEENPEGKQLVAYKGNVPTMGNNNNTTTNNNNNTNTSAHKKFYHNKVTRTFRNFLKAHLRKANEKPKVKKAFRHLLSNKTASNEKKALKVLGIIFAVFVILWTPFFIVNIISATCADCMINITPEMMSIFLWMGYVASLANPLIYTMFNTSFRRAFVKILTCKYQKPKVHNESSCMSFAASWHFDRRNTIMMLLKEEMAQRD